MQYVEKASETVSNLRHITFDYSWILHIVVFFEELTLVDSTKIGMYSWLIICNHWCWEPNGQRKPSIVVKTAIEV